MTRASFDPSDHVVKYGQELSKKINEMPKRIAGQCNVYFLYLSRESCVWKHFRSLTSNPDTAQANCIFKRTNRRAQCAPTPLDELFALQVAHTGIQIFLTRNQMFEEHVRMVGDMHKTYEVLNQR